MSIQYVDIDDRLSEEATALFCEMVEVHLSTTGDRLFISSDSFAGTRLIYAGEGSSKSWSGFDGGILRDLVGFGLLHQDFSARGTPNYRISADGRHYYGWLMGQRGQPVDQVDSVVQRLVAGEKFASAHPKAATPLAEAFGLLWSDRTDIPTLTEVGNHLRGAIMEMAVSVVGDSGQSEKPIGALNAMLDEISSSLGSREIRALKALIEYADASLSLGQRLDHIRSEADVGLPLRGWEELRRACFLVAVACYELHQMRVR